MVKLIQNSIFFKILFFITLCAISYLAFTTKHIEVVDNSWDKLNHLFAFFALFLLIGFAYKNLRYYYRFLFLTFYAVFIEIVQSFIPGREASFFDILADTIGMVLGFAVIYILDKKV